MDNFSVSESLPMRSEEQQLSNLSDENEDRPLLGRLAGIAAEVAALHQTVKERLVYDRVKEKAFDHLYAEIEEVRQERSFQQVRPLLMDLILLYDRIEQGIQQMCMLEGNMPDFDQLLKSLRDELLEILYRCEVEMIIAASPTFDRSLQQVIKVQPTAIPDEHNQVVRVVRRGFRYRNRILRSEEIIIRNYKVM